jgi:hypothetical protein
VLSGVAWIASNGARDLRPATAAPPAHAERVVLVVFGGGVRAKEFLGRPDLCPTVRAIGAAGSASDGWASAGSDPTDATKGILIGRTVPVVTPGRVRPGQPTLFECARRGLRLGEGRIWFASYADGEALDLARSDHADYGEALAPSLAVGEGPFGERLRGLFRLFGRPNPTKDKTWTLLRDLRRATAQASAVPGVDDAGTDEGMRLERALLEEVDRRAADIGGAAALDARAMRAGITVLRLFRPTLLVIRLGQADVGSEGLAAYEEVLRRDDQELARLRAEIAGDPALRATTTLIVMTDLGRDAKLNAAGGYGRADGSLEATTCAVVAEGPGVKKGAIPKAPRDVRDVAPSIAKLLGFEMPLAEGRAREDWVGR